MLISIDGIDGSGKTTQVKLLGEYLKDKDPLVLREPGGTETGEKIREILLNPKSNITNRAEIFLFMAARAQLYQETILPALHCGQIVITDRWAWSTMAYQSIDDPSILERIEQMTDFACFARWPHLSFFLDVDPSVARSRQPAHKRDRIEQRPEDYHERVWRAYQKIAKKYKEIVKVVDASMDKAHVFAQIRSIVQEALDHGSRKN